MTHSMPRDVFDLSGKVVLSTGANSGLGLAFAEGCARKGAVIIIWGRRADKNAAAADRLRAMGAPRVFTDSVDVSDEAAVTSGMERAIAAAGRIDCVFANAGISSVEPSFPDMTSNAYHRLLATNLHGAFYTMREAARHMRDRANGGDPGGSIVACGSLSIFQGTQGLEHYAAAKGAIVAMTKSMATELGPYGVRVNVIAPGFFKTAMTDTPENAAIIERMTARTPLRRVGKALDIHGIAAYLASEASSFHTGDVIVIDGGRLASAG